MPTYDYKPPQTNTEHYCIQEARITAIETKLQNKKENIHEIHEDYYHLRDKLDLLNINVAELTAILKENQENQKENHKKVEELQIEISKANLEISKLQSSISTLKYIIPIACSILTFIVNYLI